MSALASSLSDLRSSSPLVPGMIAAVGFVAGGVIAAVALHTRSTVASSRGGPRGGRGVLPSPVAADVDREARRAVEGIDVAGSAS